MLKVGFFVFYKHSFAALDIWRLTMLTALSAGGEPLAGECLGEVEAHSWFFWLLDNHFIFNYLPLTSTCGCFGGVGGVI